MLPVFSICLSLLFLALGIGGALNLPSTPGNVWVLFRLGSAFHSFSSHCSAKRGLDTSVLYTTYHYSDMGLKSGVVSEPHLLSVFTMSDELLEWLGMPLSVLECDAMSVFRESSDPVRLVEPFVPAECDRCCRNSESNDPTLLPVSIYVNVE